jgi:hypothetical protein
MYVLPDREGEDRFLGCVRALERPEPAPELVAAVHHLAYEKKEEG